MGGRNGNTENRDERRGVGFCCRRWSVESHLLPPSPSPPPLIVASIQGGKEGGVGRRGEGLFCAKPDLFQRFREFEG